jgi:hypothetical protein
MLVGTGRDGVAAHRNACSINGKSRKALRDFLHKLSLEEYEKRLGLRKVRLHYDDGNVDVVWIGRECFEKYESSNARMTELPI